MASKYCDTDADLMAGIKELKTEIAAEYLSKSVETIS
jgi:hypothetical protein